MHARMKRTVIVCLLLLMAAFASAQETDILYLKNGSVIRGTVVEMNPTENVKIKTEGGNIFSYSISEVLKLEKDNGEFEDPSNTRADDRYLIKKGKNLRFENTPKHAIYEEDLVSLLGYEYYNTYSEAWKQVSRGNDFLIAAGVSVASAIACFALSAGTDNDKLEYEYFAIGELLCIPADVFTALGCVFRGIGNSRIRWVCKEYNDRPVAPAKVSLNPSLMLDRRNDLALGATLRIGF